MVLSCKFFVPSFIDFLKLVGQCISLEVHGLKPQRTRLTERSRDLRVTTTEEQGSFLVTSLVLAAHCHRHRKEWGFYKFIYLFLHIFMDFREEGRGRERETLMMRGNHWMAAFGMPHSGDWSHNKAHALTGTQTVTSRFKGQLSTTESHWPGINLFFILFL